ncbi:MAG: alpha/beta hydrolase [Spirochaetia bacterium]|nr:alpha/beta hydrolase [Spirochaetia bacterium]
MKHKKRIPFYTEPQNPGNRPDISELDRMPRRFAKRNWGQEASMTPYLINDGRIHGCMIIAPGGAYLARFEKTVKPVIKWLLSLGLHVFILHYRLIPNYFPAPLEDAQQAIRSIRFHADAYRIDPSRIGILGFSAGGHLAALSSVYFNSGGLQDTAGNYSPMGQISSRPDIQILAYAVNYTSHETYVMKQVSQGLLGPHPSQEDREKTATYKHIRSGRSEEDRTPPAFIWHTEKDIFVPCTHSITYADALKEAGIEHELHIYKYGPHGMGLAKKRRFRLLEASEWSECCTEWLKRMHFTG